MGIIFGWINDRFKGAIDFVVDFLQVILQYRQPSGDSAWEQTVYGLAWGYGERIAVWVTVVLVLVVLYRRSYFVNLAHAVVVTVLIASFGFVFYLALDWLEAVENWLSDMATFHEAENDNNPLEIPPIDNVFFSAGALLVLVIGGGANMIIFIGLTIVSVGAVAVFLPSLALTPLGDRLKRFWNMLFAIIILARVLGRPTMILLLELAQWSQDEIGWGLDNTSFIIFITLTSALVATPFALWFLGKAAYHTPEYIKGKVEGRSKVSGDVEAKLKEGQKVTPEQARQEFDRTTPMPVVVEHAEPRKLAGEHVRDYTMAKAAVAAKAAAAYVSPTTAVRSAAIIDAAKTRMSSNTAA